jgi:hypothetical protein
MCGNVWRVEVQLHHFNLGTILEVSGLHVLVAFTPGK